MGLIHLTSRRKMAESWENQVNTGGPLSLIRPGVRGFFADKPVACLVLSRQWLHVQPDQEGGERRHLRHGPVGGPHRHHALLPESAAVLPRLDVRPARQAEPHHQDLDGNAAPARSWWGGFCFFLPRLEACRTLVPNQGSNLSPWQ